MKRFTIILTLLISTELFSEGARYLLITPDQYYDAVLPLAEWKHKKGMMTKIAKLSEIGEHASDIKSYIRNAYNNWIPRPEYILLVGDRYALPYGAYFPNWSLWLPYGRGTWTDQYYVNLTEGTDYRDDINIGRLPCENAVQCSVMVNRTLSYEQVRSVKTTDWFTKATLIARDNEPILHWDSCYRVACREIQNLLTDVGFVKVDTFFATNGAKRESVETAVNNGRGYLVYRGSTLSNTDNWRDPFEVRTEMITNDSMPTVVIAATCRNMFYPESLPTYPEPTTAAGNNWMRKGEVRIPRGAVAFFNATTHYHAGFDTGQTIWRNAIALKFFEAVTKESVCTLGEAIRRAKDSALVCCSLYTVGKTNHVTACSVAYMEWNLLGDPELNLWTGNPKLMTVTHDSLIHTGEQILAITVNREGNPVKNGLVCIIMDTTIYQYGYTDAFGNVNFPVNPLHPGQMSVTVTARNCIPYENNIRVLSEHDVGVTEIIHPIGIIDSSAILTPKVKVKNFGYSTETFNTKISIPTANWTNIKLVSNLASGEERIVEFDTWFIGIRGNYQVKCSTELMGDLMPANNKIEDSFLIRVKDYAVTSITAPVSAIDSASSIIPKAWIHNNGSVNETNVPVIIYILGTIYCDTQLISLNAGDSVLKSFRQFVVNFPRDNYTIRCSTNLNSDCVEHNNVASVSFNIRVKDFAVTNITQPVSPIDSSMRIVPKAWIYNYGTTDETNVPVTLSIDSTVYASTKNLTLYAGDSIEVTFDTFDLNIARGAYTIRCSTKLNGDIVVNNNLATKQLIITAPGRDYAVTEITAPIGMIDSTITIIPRAFIYNFGLVDEDSVPVILYILDAYYTDTQYVSLNSGNGVEQGFKSFTAYYPRGMYSVRCTTLLDADTFVANNLTIDSFRVRVRDYAVKTITAPLFDIDSGSVIIPKAWVYNYGSDNEIDVAVTFYIQNTNYANTKTVTLNASDSVEVNFDQFVLNIPRGNYFTRCTTQLNNDVIVDNNLTVDSFNVRVEDFGVSSIIVPEYPVYSNVTITPRAWIHNYGTTSRTDVPVTLSVLNTGYSSTKFVSLNINDSIEQVFDDLLINVPQDNYILKCSTQLIGDIVAHNNQVIDSLTVLVQNWTKMVGVLTHPEGKGIKDGGALVSYEGLIYAFQGGNSRNFFAYNPNTDKWVEKCSIPFAKVGDKTIKKKVKAGGSLVVKECTLYAFKGGNTTEWWAYIIEGDSWIQKRSIPEIAYGVTKKTRVKAGGALVVNACSIYAFKGGNTTEFWLYYQDTWVQRKSLITADGKRIKGGAALVVNSDTIYAFVGGNTNYFYAYTPDTWIKKHDVQFGTEKTLRKKIKDGAALVGKDGIIYSLKGGNTQDFGYYDAGQDTWCTLDTILRGINKKKIKAGGAMTVLGYSIYALKGGNTTEFWRYTPNLAYSMKHTATRTEPAIQDVNTQSSATKALIAVSPNPFTKTTVIRYSVPVSGNTTLKLYNITGDLIEILKDSYSFAGTHSLQIENWKSKLSKGVYFLQYQVNDNTEEIKIILQ